MIVKGVYMIKVFISTLSFVVLFVGCSTKNPPLTDISNAKMALVKAEGNEAATYAPKTLSKIKAKYQRLQALMAKKRYEEAKFLAQEIQADARLLERESQRLMLEKKIKKLQGEINLITKEFAEVRE
jgi:hypothetical protein